jgi:peptide/nickel transport system permease protein
VLRYVLRRALTTVAMLVAASMLIFVVLRVLPGDPTTTRLGSVYGTGADVIARLQHELGLDRPIWAQYATWFGDVVTGDLGRSYFSQEPVSRLMGGRIGPTVELTLVSLLLALLFSLPAGIAAAVRPRGVLDRSVTALSSLAMSVPAFLIAIVLIYVFAVQLKLVPTRGYVSLFDDPLENLRLIALPAVTLGFVGAGPILRYLRASLAEASNAPYMRTAEGKGLLYGQSVVRHAVPNALIPTLTVVGLEVGRLLGGVVIVEYIFGWPGLGTLIIDSVFKRDYPVLQAGVLFAAAAFIVVTLAVDLLYGVLDPRLRARIAHGDRG